MRRGWKTTEFWISAAVIVGSVTGALVGVVPVSIAATVAAISAGAYAVARGLSKIKGQ